MTLYTSPNLFDTASAMTPVTLEGIFHRLRDDANLREDTLRLRRVRQLDAGAYDRLKARLPFFCCGQFRSGIRRSEHFEAIQAWVVDVDHYSGDEAQINALCKSLTEDERVTLLFRSPSGDGVKAVFKLREPCSDTKQFSDAYKAFAFAFGQQYGLGKHIDFRTSDVTRVCFLAHDPFAYINPLAEPVDWKCLLPEQAQPQLALLVEQKQAGQDIEKPGRSHAIHPDVYAEILRKLQSKAKPNPLLRPVFVPEAIALALPTVLEMLAANGIEVAEQRDIQFGKQMALTSGQDRAEVNLYFGKKGFSVVLVPKRNTNESLGKLACFLVEKAIYSQHKWYAPPSEPDNSDHPEASPAGQEPPF